MSSADWAVLGAVVLGMGMIVSTSTRFVVARIGRFQTSPAREEAADSGERRGTCLPDVEAAMGRLLDVEWRSVRVVRGDDGVVHCVVVVAPHELCDVVMQLSERFDGVRLVHPRMAGSRIVFTAEAA